ncbi:MAG: ABC transporter ATP-binding protein [Rhizobiaceae bacterium]
MVSLHVNNVGLKYPVPRTFSLRRQVGKSLDENPVGGRLETGAGGKNYVTALEDVTFSLKAGDRLALIGPNGAGKTTLLKLLYGIFTPSTGTVTREGRVDALFNINLGFRGDVSGRRNILLRGLLNGWSRREIEARMDEIIEFSRLGDFIDMPFNSYSQGMAARLAFATATSFEPQILLMDEWIGAGDAEFAQQAQTRMDSIVARAGIIVLASHNLDLLRRVCNKALWLKQGRVEEFTKSKKVLDDYIWRTRADRLEAARAAEAARTAEAAQALETARSREATTKPKPV